jgi:hypothetical protein
MWHVLLHAKVWFRMMRGLCGGSKVVLRNDDSLGERG